MKYLHIVNGSMQLRKLSSLSTTGMALLHYLQVLPRRQLPDPMGALSFSLPSSAIAEANAAVNYTNARHQEKATKAKRGPYMKLSNELKSKSLVRTEILRQQDTSPSCSRLLNCRVERIIINNAVEFNFAQSHVRENKSGEIFPQYYTSGFGEIFPWRKFPAIRYVLKKALPKGQSCSFMLKSF